MEEKNITKDTKISNQKKDNILTKLISSFVTILISFRQLETIMKICIVIPLLIIFIIIGNKVYSSTGKETLKCNYSNSSPILALDEKINIEFRREAIYKLTKTTTYKEQNEKWKSIEEIEEEIKEKIKNTKNNDGVRITYKKSDKKIVLTEEYNYYRLSEKEMDEFNLESKITLETFKKQYEEFGYVCVSSK